MSTLSSLINVMFLINVMVLNKVSYHHVFLFTAIYFLIRRDGRKFISQTNKRAARLLESLEYLGYYEKKEKLTKLGRLKDNPISLQGNFETGSKIEFLLFSVGMVLL